MAFREGTANVPREMTECSEKRSINRIRGDGHHVNNVVFWRVTEFITESRKYNTNSIQCQFVLLF